MSLSDLSYTDTMITAKWFGGPFDGEELALRDCSGFYMPVMKEPVLADEYGSITFTKKWIRPKLTVTGWILPWRED